MLYLSERVRSGLHGLRVVTLTWKTKSVPDVQKSFKTQNWRHYSMEIRVKRKKSLHYHWKWLNETFLYASKPWEWFKSKEIGFRTNWNRGTLKGDFLLVNNCLKGKKEKVFCIAIASSRAMKNGSITITQREENRGVRPVTHQHQRQRHIFNLMVSTEAS